MTRLGDYLAASWKLAGVAVIFAAFGRYTVAVALVCGIVGAVAVCELSDAAWRIRRRRRP